MLLLALGLMCAFPSACAPAAPPVSYGEAARTSAFNAPVTIPSGDSQLLGTMYVAEGAGPHPTVLLLHGFPGGPRWASTAEMLQQAGFNVLFFHYRGTWGSEGRFSLQHALEDVEAALDFARSPRALQEYRIDPRAVALVGHSMGSWLAFQTTVRRPDLECVAGLGLANLGQLGRRWEAEPGYREVWTRMFEQATTGEGAPVRSLVSAGDLVAEGIEQATRYDLAGLAVPLRNRSVLLVGAAQDQVTPIPEHHGRVRDALRAAGNERLTEVMLEADHNFQNTQADLAASVADWLRRACLPGARAPRAEMRATTVDSAMIEVGGHRLFSKWAGEGPVTLVFEAGQMGFTAAWDSVFAPLAQVTRVFAYDRAGLGRSELSSVPLSPEQTLQELRTLLERSGQRPPFVLVAQSMGGLYARMFAHRYPSEVAGMLLVDPASENTWAWVHNNKPASEIAAVEEWIRQTGEGAWTEWTAARQVFDAAQSAWPLPELPVVVITATEIPPQPDWWDQAYRDHFTSEQRKLVAKLPSARLVVAEGSRHAIALERPHVVIDEAVKLLERVRQ
jgi:pimeloyl-ACP methyl ester carboxylesterase